MGYGRSLALVGSLVEFEVSWFSSVLGRFSRDLDWACLLGSKGGLGVSLVGFEVSWYFF